MTSSAVSIGGVGVAATLEVESTMATLLAVNDVDCAGGTMCGAKACADHTDPLSASPFTLRGLVTSMA